MNHLKTVHAQKRTVQVIGGGTRTVEDLYVNRHLMPALRDGCFPRQTPPGDVARRRANVATEAERKAGLEWGR